MLSVLLRSHPTTHHHVSSFHRRVLQRTHRRWGHSRILRPPSDLTRPATPTIHAARISRGGDSDPRALFARIPPASRRPARTPQTQRCYRSPAAGREEHSAPTTRSPQDHRRTRRCASLPAHLRFPLRYHQWLCSALPKRVRPDRREHIRVPVGVGNRGIPAGHKLDAEVAVERDPLGGIRDVPEPDAGLGHGVGEQAVLVYTVSLLFGAWAGIYPDLASESADGAGSRLLEQEASAAGAVA